MPKQPVNHETISLFLSIIIPFSIILLLLLSTNNMHTYLDSNKVLGSSVDVQETSFEIDFWNNFLQNNDQYFVGWLELSRLYLDRGSIPEAQAALIKAEKINPNSKDLQELRTLLY